MKIVVFLEGTDEIVSAAGRRWPAPRWWKLCKRIGLHRIAGWLYAKRFGFWAPGLIDLCDSYEVLHKMSAKTYAEWGS